MASAALLAACSDEEWVYRPRRDAGAVMTDATTADLGGVSDTGTDDAGMATVDVVASRDDGSGDDAGTLPSEPVLQAQGIATTSGGSLAAGTLTLTETGFEVGEPACVGSLCLTGGLVP